MGRAQAHGCSGLRQAAEGCNQPEPEDASSVSREGARVEAPSAQWRASWRCARRTVAFINSPVPGPLS